MDQEQMKQNIRAYVSDEWAIVNPSVQSPIAAEENMAGNSVLEELKLLELEAGKCTQCALHESATNLVFSDGNPSFGLVFVGEAPGADEDAQGKPFVGRGGKLLTATLAEIGISRDKVYICNILKHRPPENRNPLPPEIEACTPFLKRQLAIIKPKLVVTLGNFSTRFLLETEEGITKLRGRLFDSRFGFKVLPTLHPAAVLRNMGNLPDFKADLIKAAEFIQSA
jgi:uracil-DNA glycosylase family 4